MPLFEYVCDDCEEKFEELRPSKEPDEGVRCPSCDGVEVTRQFSSFATGAGAGGGKAGPAPSAGSCGPRGFS